MTGIRAPSRALQVVDIVDFVCTAYRVPLDDYVGRCRHKRVVFAREMTVALARRLTCASFPDIARAMGRPNHSSLMDMSRRVKARDAKWIAEVDAMEFELMGARPLTKATPR